MNYKILLESSLHFWVYDTPDYDKACEESMLSGGTIWHTSGAIGVVYEEVVPLMQKAYQELFPGGNLFTMRDEHNNLLFAPPLPPIYYFITDEHQTPQEGQEVLSDAEVLGYSTRVMSAALDVIDSINERILEQYFDEVVDIFQELLFMWDSKLEKAYSNWVLRGCTKRTFHFFRHNGDGHNATSFHNEMQDLLRSGSWEIAKGDGHYSLYLYHEDLLMTASYHEQEIIIHFLESDEAFDKKVAQWKD